ncbi:MAG TPA: PilZ domain-containing protein [Sphingomicrobium sp.]|nr:PilZ domain-containing protein [Sphingomicrobium sp.]
MRMTDQLARRRRMRIAGRARAANAARTARATQAPVVRPAAVTQATTLPIDEERRCCSRVALNGEVVVRRIGGFNFQVALREVSRRGCRVELVEPCEVGDPMITRFAQLEPLGSRVCWTQGTTTGVEFTTNIHPAVFDHLLARLIDAESRSA